VNAGASGPTQLLPHEFEGLRRVIRQVAGIHLRETKKPLVAGRLQRRLRELGLESFSDYLRLVEDSANGDERKELINCITTNKTSFFREPHHFDFLRGKVIPEILERVRAGMPKRIRIWSAGCSTGQEPWTIAMTVADALGSLAGWDVRILASDLDTNVLESAEHAVYDDEELASVPAPLRDRWFEPVAGGHRVNGALRALVTFRRINLVDFSSWKIRTHFDVIFCRNVAIYFDRPTQEALFDGLASLLEPTGYLLSGHSENLHGLSHVLRPLGNTVHVPMAQPSGALRGPRPAPAVQPRNIPPSPSPSSSPSPSPSTPEIAIQVGGVQASATGARLRTTLGSCIAVCLHDPEAQVGGMNHFLLPHDRTGNRGPSSFGVHAMEMLINAMMKLGGERHRFVAKVFGASQQFGPGSQHHVAKKNADFVLRFLADEGIPVVAQKLGARSALSVVFDTAEGRAFVRTFNRAPGVVEAERRHLAALSSASRSFADDITFFGAA